MAAIRIPLGRLQIFLFVREYYKLHTWKFGVSFDAIKSFDSYFDVEILFFCLGIGIRFVLIKKNKDL